MIKPSIHIKTKEDVQTLLVILFLAFIIFVKCYMLVVNHSTDHANPLIKFRANNRSNFYINKLSVKNPLC